MLLAITPNPPNRHPGDEEESYSQDKHHHVCVHVNLQVQ